MPEAAIALGSNLGNRESNLEQAVRCLGALGVVLKVSGFFDTTPVGYVDQPRFLNAALLLETRLSPLELLDSLLEVEQTMGRVRAGVPTKGPRLVDLDLLLYRLEDGTQVVLTSVELEVPHPGLHEREFVLEPLAEIAAGWVHPVLGRTVAELRAGLG